MLDARRITFSALKMRFRAFGPAHLKLGLSHSKLHMAHSKLGLGHLKLDMAHLKLGLGHSKLGPDHLKLDLGHSKLPIRRSKLGTCHSKLGLARSRPAGGRVEFLVLSFKSTACGRVSSFTFEV